MLCKRIRSAGRAGPARGRRDINMPFDYTCVQLF